MLASLDIKTYPFTLKLYSAFFVAGLTTIMWFSMGQPHLTPSIGPSLRVESTTPTPIIKNTSIATEIQKSSIEAPKLLPSRKVEDSLPAYKVSLNAKGVKDPSFDSDIINMLDASNMSLEAASKAMTARPILLKTCKSDSKRASSSPQCTSLIALIKSGVFNVARAEAKVDAYMHTGKVSDTVLEQLEKRLIEAQTFHETYPNVGPHLSVELPQ